MTTYQPLGDQALLASCAEERTAFQLASAIRGLAPVWLIDVVQAYTTVAIFFDSEAIRYQNVLKAIGDLAGTAPILNGRLHEVPCCYSMGPDLQEVARHCGLTADEVIALHTGTDYTIYAIGFCPGFPYLGYLSEALSGVPRLPAPRLRVEAGSVGLTGRQTGIYTEPRPGGWSLIGRTPLVLVDVADGFFPLRTGDQVRFLPIDDGEYRRLLGQRLVAQEGRLTHENISCPLLPLP